MSAVNTLFAAASTMDSIEVLGYITEGARSHSLFGAKALSSSQAPSWTAAALIT